MFATTGSARAVVATVEIVGVGRRTEEGREATGEGQDPYGVSVPGNPEDTRININIL